MRQSNQWAAANSKSHTIKVAVDAGQRLQGQMILEVPVQTRAIPQSVLDAANNAVVIIRDINRRIY